MSNPLLEDIDRNQEPNSLILALPTLGRFYPQGILSPKADATGLEVYPLGIAAEIHLNDPLLLASGKAIPKLVRSICPEVYDAERLCGIDIDALLMASRIASHGEMMKMDVTCQKPKCGNQDAINVNLQDVILKYAPMTDDVLATLIVPIPDLNQKVCVQPPTYHTGLEIIRNTITIQRDLGHISDIKFEDFIQDEKMMDEYMEIAERNAVLSLSALVDSIFYVETSTGQKVVDKEAITEWAMRLKREQLVGVRAKIQKLTHDIDQISHIDYQCSKCGHKNSVRLTLDPQKLFFYEQDGSEPTKKSPRSSTKSGSARKRPSRTSQR